MSGLMQTITRKRWLWRGGQVLLLALIVYFWGRSMAAGWSDLRDFTWQVRPLFLLGSFAFLMAHLFFLAAIWRWSLNSLGIRCNLREATRIWALSQIARYLPGGVWDVAGRLVLAGQAGHSRRVISVSILIEMILQTIAAVLIFLSSLVFWEDPTVARLGLWSIPIVPAGLIALHPQVLNGLLRVAGRLTKRDIAPISLRFGAVLRLLLAHLLGRIIVGTGFYLFAAGIHPWEVSAWPAAVGIFSGAWVVGFLIVFIPQGLGVREGVLTFLLGAFLPVAAAGIIALGFRAWMSLRDLLFAGVGLLLSAQRAPSNTREGAEPVKGEQDFQIR